jgi:hypothetical protein
VLDRVPRKMQAAFRLSAPAYATGTLWDGGVWIYRFLARTGVRHRIRDVPFQARVRQMQRPSRGALRACGGPTFVRRCSSAPRQRRLGKGGAHRRSAGAEGGGGWAPPLLPPRAAASMKEESLAGRKGKGSRGGAARQLGQDPA